MSVGGHCISESEKNRGTASALVTKYRQSIAKACQTLPALDLACGLGRNGQELVRNGIATVFADRDGDSLKRIQMQMTVDTHHNRPVIGRTWQVDLETGEQGILPMQAFGAILVFRYLHRPLMRDIRNALAPGGLLIYETFTTEQAKLGRPKNPNFLLRTRELEESFGDWMVLHAFEGLERDAISGSQRAIAQIVTRKPS